MVTDADSEVPSDSERVSLSVHVHVDSAVAVTVKRSRNSSLADTVTPVLYSFSTSVVKEFVSSYVVVEGERRRRVSRGVGGLVREGDRERFEAIRLDRERVVRKRIGL